jgi:hypothetical protein
VLLDVQGQQCRSDGDCVGLFGRDYVCGEQHVCIEDDSPAPGSGMQDAGGSHSSTRPEGFECLDDPPRTVVAQIGRFVSLRFVVTDFVDLTVPSGLFGKACETRDVRCENPIEGLDHVTPDPNGFLNFENLPHGWRGYMQISAPMYVDSLVYSNRAYGEDAMTEGPTVLKPSQLNEIAMGGGEMIDMTKGIVILTAYDCEGHAAPGVRFEQDDAEATEVPFYFEGTLPDRERTTTIISTELTQSHAPLAAGGFSHITPGYVTFVAVLDETDEEIGRVTVQVRALNMTYAEIHAGY